MMSYVHGYKIPFCKRVIQHTEPSNPPFSEHEMQKAINKLINLGAITLCEENLTNQFISSVFLTPKSNGGYRFILNLKTLNKLVYKHHFKMEDIRTAAKLVTKHAYMATIDLKEAYFLVPIHPSHRKYLRFRFNSKLFEFNCLPYGLTSAPFVFTKLLKPLLALLRGQGHTLVAYLDDILCIGKSYESCKNTVNILIRYIQLLGLVINFDKSNLEPLQTCRFLGLEINTNLMRLQLPHEKISKIVSSASKITSKTQISIREFAKFIGTLTSACPAVAYGWAHTKHFEREKFLALLQSNNNFDSIMSLKSYLSHDLSWWCDIKSKSYNDILKGTYQLEIFTDSSLTGWGAACNGEITRGHWSADESQRHINYLELAAAFLGLQSFCKHSHNINVLLRIDNTTAISYINRMGGVQYPHLNEITRKIWQWCEQKRIFIFASYIKSSENIDADRASRYTNVDTEWELNHKCFQKITWAFGQPDIDLFASRLNKKCEQYVSWKRDPHAYEIDAFTISWRDRFFYAFPPFALILKCVSKIAEDEATGIIIVPYWPAQPWFPKFLSLVRSEIIYFKPNKNLLLSPSRGRHPLWPSLTLACAVLCGKPT